MNGRGVLLVLSLSSSALLAAPELRPLERLGDGGQFELRTESGPGRELARRGGFVLRELMTTRWSGREELLPGATDFGAGADVVGLTLIQTRFRDTACPLPPTCEAGPCNTLDILWQETTPNVLGVNVLVNGLLIGTVSGAGALPADRGVSIGGFTPAVHTIALQEVRSEGAAPAPLTQQTILVLDKQPFGDPTNAECLEQNVGADGRCTLAMTFENSAPPGAYRVSFERTIVGLVDGDTSPVSFNGLQPGEYLIGLAGLMTTDAGNYEGCPIEFSCTIQCARTSPCQEPVGLTLFQTVYGSETDGNEVQFTWINGETFYTGGVRLLLDSELLAMVPPNPDVGNPIQGVAADLPAGEVTIGVQGDCAADSESTITEAVMPLLTESPHTLPVEPGSLMCSWQPADQGTTEVSWAAGDRSDFLFVFLERDGLRRFLGLGDSATVRATIRGTLPTDTVVLQFFAPFGGFLYGSDLVRCTPGNPPVARFIRSICDAATFVAGGESPDVLPRPDISSASFLLNLLFLGGPTPVCREACDSDGNSTVDISDASYLLNFLFLGGNPPPGWGIAAVGFDPTCEVADEAADCATGHEACGP